jgi:nitrate/TMAO reductase-like tetraheme cytochrome c subunit
LLTLGLPWALVGMVGLIGFDLVVEQTSTTDFCLSCHEMKIMQEELSKTVHFKNRTGVRVACGDCHVPRGQPDKLIAKVQALDDVYAHFVGTIDTPEKFEARREEMAHTVWAEMKANGSRACRACHAFEAMEFSKQADRPRRKHNEAMISGETCIDCHKGIAHALPKGFRK